MPLVRLNPMLETGEYGEAPSPIPSRLTARPVRATKRPDWQKDYEVGK